MAESELHRELKQVACRWHWKHEYAAIVRALTLRAMSTGARKGRRVRGVTRDALGAQGAGNVECPS